ncbi:bifunctional phosphoribosyl-AMP cyclohydrolase/phosphoribosyl-ATP diphosphatase HisIE [Alicyclobacillus tolerans]|uniref:bifunctional phosphoribosyl-AMP cyclohydrolase/phosphoribosyl-ATP diphosphatase HisIE n=1 Tax=Alicyclobacillus tolerans TaxID=90970 RepID=UPI001F00F099|nr:bifunctional phosphoribosyl-AMP cyclohydrolase/phosphoribosyl-ATP diphosphatase HisIE [Alicyclobacillus tolerans]MCF8564034.1 bifunctional phosphoribosyl-AMP cyclohydrolase/phosphoribosyl-ATP diphosphatase HisIE [Alicyclobacillus tolerans]
MVRYDTQTGLVPVVVQDEQTGAVLTLAYANREALKRTLGTGQAWFWSRSRQDYWRKGETSGNVQTVVQVRIDCDGDAVLYLVRPAGPACHTGEYSCFYRNMEHKNPAVSREQHAEGIAAGNEGPAVDTSAGSSASEVVSQAGRTAARTTASSDGADEAVLQELWQVIHSRWVERPQGSYTTYLFEHGVDKTAKKVGEEGVEVAIAAKNAAVSEAGQKDLCEESADLLFHLMALWKQTGLEPSDVYGVLAQRHRAKG